MVVDTDQTEWQNLRAELQALDSACLSILEITVALSVGLLGWFYSRPPADLAVVTTVSIVWLLAYVYMAHKRKGIRVIASYLRIFIESEPDLPKWETRIHSFRPKRGLAARLNPEHVELLAAISFQALVLSLVMNSGLLALVPTVALLITIVIFASLKRFAEGEIDSTWEAIKKKLDESAGEAGS